MLIVVTVEAVIALFVSLLGQILAIWIILSVWTMVFFEDALDFFHCSSGFCWWVTITRNLLESCDIRVVIWIVIWPLISFLEGYKKLFIIATNASANPSHQFFLITTCLVKIGSERTEVFVEVFDLLISFYRIVIKCNRKIGEGICLRKATNMIKATLYFALRKLSWLVRHVWAANFDGSDLVAQRPIGDRRDSNLG